MRCTKMTQVVNRQSRVQISPWTPVFAVRPGHFVDADSLTGEDRAETNLLLA
jgi:hypothetical protein